MSDINKIKLRIAIIGGGLAGISAALEARLSADKILSNKLSASNLSIEERSGARINRAEANAMDISVTLFEARNRLGGATWSFEKDGVTYDNGQHVFLRCCDAYLEFLERIGSRKSVYIQPRLVVPVVDVKSGSAKYSYIQRRGRYLPGLFLYKHLPFRKRLRAIRTALKISKLDSNDARLDQISFADWLKQQGETKESIDRLWNLIVLPTVNVDAYGASLKLAVKVFTTGLLENAKNADIGYGLKPFSELHDKAAQETLAELGVDVALNTRVEKIIQQDFQNFDKEAKNKKDASGENNSQNNLQGSSSHFKITTAEKTYEADAVILALPHNQLSEIVFGDDNLLKNKLPIQKWEKLGVSPIINIHFVFDKKIMKHNFIAGIGGFGGTEIQYVFDRTEAAGLGDSEAQCLALSLSSADKYLPLKTKELETHFYNELQKIFPKIKDAKLLHSMVTRENSATFRGAPKSHGLRAQTKTQVNGLFMAGAYTDTGWPATMEGAVRSGKKAAQMALLINNE